MAGSGDSLRLLVQAAGVAALLWIGYSLSRHGEPGDGAPPPPFDASGTDEIDALRERVARLEANAEHGGALRLIEAAEAAAEPERRPLAGALSDAPNIAAQLAALRAELRQWAARERASGGGMAGAQRHRAADWTRLAQYHQRFLENDDAAREELLFSTEAEVLARFGKPQRTTIGQVGQLTWYYQRAMGETEQSVRITFREGYAIDARCR